MKNSHRKVWCKGKHLMSKSVHYKRKMVIWTSCYMKKVFTLGMRSIQLSESVNGDIKSFMNVNLDIIKLFKCFEDVVEEK